MHYWHSHITHISGEETDGDAYFGLIETIMLNQLKLKAEQMIKILKHHKSLADVVSIMMFLS